MARNNVDSSQILQQKLADLRKIIKDYKQVAVAYSGGVDSTVLLHNCCLALGPERVLALQAVSCLLAEESLHSAVLVLQENFSSDCRYLPVKMQPLKNPEFVQNRADRCYVCKHMIFSRLIEIAGQQGCEIVLDGTNKDDLTEDRPGLQAIKELGVRSPLSEAGLCKKEIRRYAKQEGLINHNLPSNSCLATRIPTNREITSELLTKVELAEAFLHQLGIVHCRVRLQHGYCHIHLAENEMEKVLAGEMRTKIHDFFQTSGLGAAYICLSGR